MIFVAGNLTDEDQILLSLVATTIGTASAFEHQADRSVDRLKGQLDEKEGAYKISFPCDDIAVSVDGWEIPAFMGLTTWTSFIRASHSQAMVVGDTVLFGAEVNLAMEPRIIFFHRGRA